MKNNVYFIYTIYIYIWMVEGGHKTIHFGFPCLWTALAESRVGHFMFYIWGDYEFEWDLDIMKILIGNIVRGLGAPCSIYFKYEIIYDMWISLEEDSQTHIY